MSAMSAPTSIFTEEGLARLAQHCGLRPASARSKRRRALLRGGALWGDAHWGCTHRDDWLVCSRRTSAPSGQEPLALHAGWRGPFKVTHRKNGDLDERAEFFLPRGPGSGFDPMVDADVNKEFEALVSGLLSSVASFDRGTPGVAGPVANTAPSAQDIRLWLREAGREATIDENQHLGLVLKRRGADGQVRIERGEGTLRVVMRLGGWKEVSPQAREAMLLLARQANSRIRLARIVWTENDNHTVCDAVCDLTGLPTSEGVGQDFFKGMLGMAVSGLELALRQLGVELAILARPEGAEVVKLLLSS